MEKVISSSDLESINTYLNSFLSNHERITASDVYNNIKGKLSNQYDENVFKAQLSKAIKDGKLGNLTTLRGPHGGIRFASKQIANTTSPLGSKVAENNVDSDDDVKKISSSDIEEEIHEVVKHTVKPYFTSPQPVISKPLPPPVIRHTLVLNGKTYEIPHTVSDVKTLLTKVLELQENDNGVLEFDNAKYNCTEEQVIFLDKFLFFFYGAALAL